MRKRTVNSVDGLPVSSDDTVLKKNRPSSGIVGKLIVCSGRRTDPYSASITASNIVDKSGARNTTSVS